MGGALVDWFDLAYGGQAHLLTISYEAHEEVTFASELLHAQHIINCAENDERGVLLDNKNAATYPLPMSEEVKHNRRRGRTRISGKHQVTLPVDALAGAGLKVGDRLRADVSGPGQITLVREDDPLEQFAGALTGVYPEGYLDDLRREWT